MKYGVIDIGSNSVRLMLWQGGATLYKKIIITKLGERLSSTGRLCPAAMDRTACAVLSLSRDAYADGADIVYTFATAAVRCSENGGEFVSLVKQTANLDIDVITGEEEAVIGLMGALRGGDGAIVDIGGASSEIIVSRGGEIIYTYSLDLGTVRLVDMCGQDKSLLNSVITDKIREYGEIPHAEFYGIGGTATSLAAVDLGLAPYDPKKIDGYALTRDRLHALADRLISLNVAERKKLKGLQPERAEVIAGGALLLSAIVDKVGLKKITVSESDNLEGYLLRRLNEERK